MRDLIERLLNPRSFDHEALRKEAAARIRELGEELGRLRTGRSCRNDLRGDYPRNIGVEITEAFADNQRLRAEVTELHNSNHELRYDNDRLRAEKAELTLGLKHYVNMYCEGWCKEYPDAPYEDGDCGGCKARTVLAKYTNETEGK